MPVSHNLIWPFARSPVPLSSFVNILAYANCPRFTKQCSSCSFLAQARTQGTNVYVVHQMPCTERGLCHSGQDINCYGHIRHDASLFQAQVA